MSAARCALPLSWAPRVAAALCLVLVGLVVAAAAAGAAEPNFPVLTNRITDQAGLLSAEDYTAIQAELTALEQKSTDQFAVVTVKSLDGYPIEDYGSQLGRKWGIGQAGKHAVYVVGGLVAEMLVDKLVHLLPRHAHRVVLLWCDIRVSS